MRCILLSLFIRFFSGFTLSSFFCLILCQLIHCQFRSLDRLAKYIELVNCDSLILHGYGLVLSVIRNFELDLFCDRVSIRSGNLLHDISLSNLQAGNRMRLFIGSPAVYILASLLIGDGNLCSRQFLLSGHIGLGHGDLLIEHLHSLDRESIIDREVDVRCPDIAFRSDLFMKGIAASDVESGNGMWLFSGYPLVDFLTSPLIGDFQGCPRDLIFTGHIRLAHEDLGVGKSEAVIREPVLRYSELNRICQNISFRSLGLDQSVGLPCLQSGYRISISIRSPGIHDLSLTVPDLQLCAGDHGDLGVDLADQHLLVHHGHSLVCQVIRDGKVDRLCLHISLRDLALDQAVGMADLQVGSIVLLSV